MTQEEPKPSSMSLRCRLLLTALFFVPAVYFKLEGDLVLAVACVVAGLAAFGGYRAGAASILALFAAATAAIVYAPELGLAHEWRFSQWFGTTGLTNRFLSVLLIGLLIGGAVMIVSGFLVRRLYARKPNLATWDRWVGFAVGAIEGIAVVAFFLGGMMMIEPLNRRVSEAGDPEHAQAPAVSKFIEATAARTRRSRVGPTLVEYNPFTRIPALNKFEEIQKSVQVLGDSEGIDQLLNHPSIQQLQQHPVMRRTMAEIRSDPEIQAILQSDAPINRSAVITLMNHPAVLALIDQPGFLEEAKNVIRNVSLSDSLRP